MDGEMMGFGVKEALFHIPAVCPGPAARESLAIGVNFSGLTDRSIECEDGEW